MAAREEIFGPVAYLAPFDDEEEAVRMVNETDYGLANSVWTSDLDRARRVAEAMVAGQQLDQRPQRLSARRALRRVNKSGMGGGVLSVPRRCSTTGEACRSCGRCKE